jgi:hypothetical protein
MARLIECDRCRETIRLEKDVRKATVEIAADSTTNYELCGRCADALNDFAQQAPVRAMRDTIPA